MSEEAMRVIRSRESSREPFDLKRPLSDRDLEQILEAGSWAPTAHNMQNFEIIVVDDPETLQALGRLRNPISMDFIRENYAQLSFSEEELRQKKTGVLASRFPPAWSNPAATPEELSAAPRPLPPSPIMLFVTYDPSRRAPASEGDFLGVISLGCLTENMWLTATSLGIGFHIVSSLASGAVEAEVKRLLAIPSALRIVYAIRLGYPAVPAEPSQGGYLRVRRTIADFAHRNRYGQRHGMK
jgi:nitroreductase